MKVTDQEIFRAIWSQTIFMIAHRSLTHYTSKRYSLPRGGVNDESYATYLVTNERRRLGLKLGDCQLLKRIRKLDGISWDRPTVYRIDSPHRSAMYYRAIDLFRSMGIEEEPTPITDIKINIIKSDVEKILMDELINIIKPTNGEQNNERIKQ